ncbi:unnamed protein product [Symbiodinium natans]|uniref:Uncharacterized protein n=1 Tax=Symbiodinium natans TaxID=878477 RepID=A0A812QWC7_9DINO|nr:unnamed protein product [Symbiodinium natans]
MPLNPWRSDFELVHGLRAESGRGRSLEISESSNFVCVAVFKNCCFCLPLQKQSNITSTAAHGPIRSTVAMQAGMEVSEQEESGSSRSYLHSNDPEDPNTPTNGGVEAASEHLGDQGEENQSFGWILELKPSVYEAALVVPLFGRRAATAWVWFLLTINFVMQFAVVYILYTQVSEPEPSPSKDFYSREEESSLCSWARGDKGTSLKGLDGTVLVCSMDEVLLTRDFDTLDLDGDGRWTYAEAKKLDERHRALTGHRTNLGSVFDNLMLLVRQFAQSHPSFLCKPGDYVAGFLENQGWWYRNLTILGQQVHSGQKGTIVQSNAFTYGYNTLDKYFKVTEVSLMTMPDEVGTVCRMAPCIDTDYGRLDGTHHGGCAWYGFEGLTMEEEYPLGMNGSYDSGGLRLRDLCCFFGGGTTSPNRTGFGSYPINLAVQDIFPVTEFFQCTENHRESHCMRQFASMPRRYYKQELEPLLDLCLVADVDMCGNLLSRQAWPGLFAQGLKKHFWDMLENVTVPLLFKAAGTSEVRQLKAEAHCEAVMTHICPVLFKDLPQWKSRRLQECGQRATVSAPSHAFPLAEFQQSADFNAPMGLRTLVFQVFLNLLVCLWAIANVEELRDVITWWLTLCRMPEAKATPECVAKTESEEGQEQLRALPRCHRLLLIAFVHIPRSILFLMIFNVGILFLFVVRDMTDLVLNSLALTFLVTVDDLLFIAFVDQRTQDRVTQLQVETRIESPFGRLIRKSKLSRALLLFLPLLAVVVVQAVMHFKWTAEVGDSLSCLCEASGDMCFTDKALNATVSHIYQR